MKYDNFAVNFNRMQKTTSSLIILFLALMMSSCAGIKYLTVETREPAQVNLPSNVLSIANVNKCNNNPMT
jgi:PBP1b-binding outer membrane lipoprotein LpoB